MYKSFSTSILYVCKKQRLWRDSSEPSLPEDAIGTIILCAGPKNSSEKNGIIPAMAKVKFKGQAHLRKQIETSLRLISVSLSNVLYCIYDVSVVT